MASNAPDETQSSFSAGEVSKECYGRTDIPTYKQALRLCRNFIPCKHGALKNRSGTRFVAACKNPTGPAPRLIPFVFSDGQTFVLEVGDHSIRFHRNGAPVLVSGVPAYSSGTAYKPGALVTVAGAAFYCFAATTGIAPPNALYWYPLTGNIYEIPAPWLIADVPRIKYAQSGDVITVVHPNYPPRNLERFGNTNWVIATSLLAPPTYPGPAITSPSIPCPPVGYQPGGVTNDTIELFDPAATYATVTPPTTSLVAYIDPTVPGSQQAVYYTVLSVFPTVPPSYPSGSTGPLAAPSAYWTLYTYNEHITYLINQYAWALAPDVLGIAGNVLFRATSPSQGQFPPSNVGGSPPGPWALAGTSADLTPTTYAVTMLLKNTRGVVIESMPTYHTPVGGVFARLPQNPYALVFWPQESPPVVPSYVIVGINIYVGTNGVYGFVDSLLPDNTGALANYFIDLGGAPDFNQAPPAGTNPFAISTPGGTTTYSYPGAVCYFQQRLIFGRTDANPNSFWGSSIGNFLDFDRPDFVTDSDSFLFPVAETKLKEIRSIVPQRELLIFTSSSETVASGSNGGVGGAITPTSIDVRDASQHGSSYLDPVVADHSVLEVTAKGCYIRDLQYDFRSASYTGRDITSLVRHLLDGHTIVDWFYAETPDSLIWIIRDDGVALSLTYEQDFQVVAFAQHTSNQAILGALPGLFQRVCSVPEGTEDAVYFVVQRTVSGQAVNYIERLSSRVIDGPNGPQDYRQVCFLDCAVSYNGRNASGPTAILTLTPFTNWDPAIVYAASQTAVLNGTGYVALQLNQNTPPNTNPAYWRAQAGFIGTASVINATPFAITDQDGNNLVIRPDGVPQPSADDNPAAPLPPLVARIVNFNSSNSVRIEAPAAPADLSLYTGTSNWAIARDTFTGLTQLEGLAVGALVDGEADLGAANNTVLAGSITLTEPGVDVTIGLPYCSDLQTLDTVGYRTNKRLVQSASIEVVNSRTFSVGENFNKMNALKSRQVANGYGLSPLLDGMQPLSMANSWNTSGAICLRMKDPLPLTVVSIVRTLEVGGKG